MGLFYEICLGDSFSVSVTVHNGAGRSTAAAGWTGNVFVGDSLVGSYVEAGGIAGDGDSQVSVAVTIPAGLVPGSYPVRVTVDVNDLIVESTESNNSLLGDPITVNTP